MVGSGASSAPRGVAECAVAPLQISSPFFSRILITILSLVAEQRRNPELVYRHLVSKEPGCRHI